MVVDVSGHSLSQNPATKQGAARLCTAGLSCPLPPLVRQELSSTIRLQVFHKVPFRICRFGVSSAVLWEGELFSDHEFCYFCVSLTTNWEVTLWNNFNLFVKTFLVFNRIFKSILVFEVSNSLFPSLPSHQFLDMTPAFRFSAELHFSFILCFWPTNLALPWRIRRHTSNLGLSWSFLSCRIWSFVIKLDLTGNEDFQSRVRKQNCKCLPRKVYL